MVNYISHVLLLISPSSIHDIILVAWNQSWWAYLHPGNLKIWQIRLDLFLFCWLPRLKKIMEKKQIMHIKLKSGSIRTCGIESSPKVEEILIVFDTNIWFSKEVTVSLTSKEVLTSIWIILLLFLLMGRKLSTNIHVITILNCHLCVCVLIAWLWIQALTKSQKQCESIGYMDAKQSTTFISQCYISFISVKFYIKSVNIV